MIFLKRHYTLSQMYSPLEKRLGHMALDQDTDLPLSPKLETLVRACRNQTGFCVKNGKGII